MAQNRSPSRPSRPRQWLYAILSRLANQQVVFAFTALAILCAKCVHAYAHWDAITWKQRKRWGFSFFAQDVGLILLIRILLDPRLPKPLPGLRFFLNVLTVLLVIYNICVCLISTTFFFVAGAEIHWRNVGLAGDAASQGLVLSGIFTLIVVVAVTLLMSWVLQSFVYGLVGFGADLIIGFFTVISSTFRKIASFRTRYSQLPQQAVEDESAAKYDLADDSNSDNGTKGRDENISRPLFFRLIQALLSRVGITVKVAHVELAFKVFMYLGVTALLLAFLILSLIRPKDGTLTFLSWTTMFLPFVDLSSSPPSLQTITPLLTQGIAGSWDKLSALTPMEPLDWLPADKPLDGFEDWYNNKKHYNASADPMKISNLESPIVESLRDILKDVPIRHVLVILLESTRNDVFPIKKGGLVWDRLAATWPNNTMPEEVEEKLANLTPTAKFITGDYDDGFDQDEDAPTPKRGGVRFTNAHTTATYTLKSLTGTLCGLTPLLVDFDHEFDHHFYQPCLPHIFEAMNNIDRTDFNASDPYALAKWQSYYFLSTVLRFDNAEHLMARMGFPENHTIGKEYLTSDEAKHGTVKLKDVNYFGFEEDPLEDYIRDAFESAKENDERVFLTHLTSTSHHPFGIPLREEYVALADGLNDLSHYLNAEGYVDKWLKKILDLLDEQEVADETLVVFVGDHGLSMPENDIVSTYYNPSIGNDHVPLILSHPKLPAIDIDEPVSSVQILPTILDLLLETGSLDDASAKAASDLVANYEGQSLVRPMNKANHDTGDWQFTVVNPGRAMLDVRDARYPELHLVVPVVDHVEWRLSNVTEDPREKGAVQGFSFRGFRRKVRDRFGFEVAMWLEEAAFRTRWWVSENSKRWRYGLFAQRG